jgi:cytochrome d ubiquinol oxidase subunit I
MDDILAARSQMAMSLAFHMVFATFGIGLPLLATIARAWGLLRGEPGWGEVARQWGKGTAILFAVGAVSGTVLSFELGLLWPTFMERAGPIIGLPFTLEGFAFFFEAIFLGIWLYGWDRVPPWAHLLSGVGVSVSGALSAAFVVCANAWMNTPVGFELAPDGTLLSVDPLAALLNPAAGGQVLHMLVAAYLATAFAVAGVHAWYLRKDRGDHEFHARALTVALGTGIVMALAQPLTGHVIGEQLAHQQPLKLAALEAHWETGRAVPFTVGGWVDEQAEQTRYALSIPYLLSFVATGDLQGEVPGLKDFPREDWPPVAVAHYAYQVMLMSAGVLVLTALAGAGLWARGRQVPTQRPWLTWLVLASPFGMLGIEAGWTASEVARQPWVVRGYLRTADAATSMPGLEVPFLMFTMLYLFLGAMTVLLLRRQFHHAPGYGDHP